MRTAPHLGSDWEPSPVDSRGCPYGRSRSALRKPTHSAPYWPIDCSLPGNCDHDSGSRCRAPAAVFARFSMDGVGYQLAAAAKRRNTLSCRLDRRCLVAALTTAICLSAHHSSSSQFTSSTDRSRAILEGNWQSCRESEQDDYAERIYDGTAPGVGR